MADEDMVMLLRKDFTVARRSSDDVKVYDTYLTAASRFANAMPDTIKMTALRSQTLLSA